MGDDPSQGEREIGWTLAQRRALIILLVLFFGWLCYRYATNRASVADPQPPQGARASELATRIDPNTADWQTLAAIPGMGEKKARAIVEYRERVHAHIPTAVVFAIPADLQHIRGIGAATVENLQPYLIFPGDPITQPKDRTP
ncbi:MAG TPA: helix-hairpin-helix domain-containing protein [Tepidisphaeraceae bacterium]|nr:helix-hairpin-helix domain-containing protein [Tepidisphaeraceae bacterium]